MIFARIRFITLSRQANASKLLKGLESGRRHRNGFIKNRHCSDFNKLRKPVTNLLHVYMKLVWPDPCVATINLKNRNITMEIYANGSRKYNQFLYFNFDHCQFLLVWIIASYTFWFKKKQCDLFWYLLLSVSLARNKILTCKILLLVQNVFLLLAGCANDPFIVSEFAHKFFKYMFSLF